MNSGRHKETINGRRGEKRGEADRWHVGMIIYRERKKRVLLCKQQRDGMIGREREMGVVMDGWSGWLVSVVVAERVLGSS